MPPLVTIGVPVFNGEPYLAASLDSLISQDHGELEIIISDNASTDSTADVCERLCERDPRVRYVRANQNRGASWNYNRVLELARGPFFKWAAADDVCEPSFVRRCVEALEGSPDAVLAFPRTLLIDEHDEALQELDDSNLELVAEEPHERLGHLLLNRFEWHPVFGVIRTEALRRSRGMGGFVLADVALLAELSLMGPFIQVSDRLFLRRYHGNRSVAANPGFEEQAAWFDPRNEGRRAFPQARLALELGRSIRHVEGLAAAERAACLHAALRAWVLPHWRHIGGEVKRSIRLAAAGAPSRG